MTTRKELVEVGARALATFWAASEKQPTDTDRAAASAALNAVLPLITEAIADAIIVTPPGAVPDRWAAGRIAREWRPR